ncbi:beta-1,4-mannosyl-glycoprotein beta-1,4-N-acetylglucosaminyltransferase [Pseudovibrio denitrificans]|uniref:Beta-1,4-mannosyl-glycoprotein beta-1,4-N-acetylglucosaminyltransferase n=1 Tax=Pseudovibrio denitrificans TaxID=258256 RepID=A0A1I6X9M6_9HYPH|nr:N-acetylglucosaminyltransferase [Pseudovibrio denitrificans]SFT34721.1 beta-1,4-mannosyl-glycoprotein beta-1,4-N-acetylglucosaminyltransferase [Pseudovibrio denitrificans]
MVKVVDGFTFFNELDTLEIRLGELFDVVDEFILVEATKTFTGAEKPLYFADNKSRFAPFLSKIRHVIVEDMPQNPQSAWSREYHQRDGIERGLKDLAVNDLILVSDVDEIPKPDVLLRVKNDPKSSKSLTFFGADIFRYRLNFKDHVSDFTSCPRMIGAMFFKGAQALRRERAYQSKSLHPVLETALWHWKALTRHSRLMRRQLLRSSSWHFSFLGDMEKVVTKLEAYSHTEHMNDAYLGRAQRTLDRLDAGDGRGKLVTKDSGELPDYVLENFAKFSHLYVEPQAP